MKKAILLLTMLFMVTCFANAETVEPRPHYGKIHQLIDRVQYKAHMNKRHKTFKKQHRKNVKYQHKLHSR